MEGREERDPGYDDWFDEPEPPTETQSAAGRGVYEDVEEVWVLPEEDDDRGPRNREIVIGGRTLTTAQAAIIAVSVLAVFFAILAAFGVFNGKKTPAPPVAPPVKHVTTTTHTQTPPVTKPTTEAPTSQLKPGDTGPQVTILQRALTKLGYSPGKPDGDYGINTKVAVERFQAAKGLDQDGTVGPQTLSAIQKALANT
jgi:Putative peptidoglycan binding domain